MARSKEYYQDWYLKNKDRLKKKYEDNKEDILEKAKKRYDPIKKGEYNKKYVEEHKEEKVYYNKAYYTSNKEEILEQHKGYVAENKEKIKNYLKEYNQNPEKIINRRKKVKEKYDNDECFKFSLLFRNNLSLLLKKNGLLKNKKTEEILGCNLIEFRVYLESKFEIWMNWENKGLYNGEMSYGWDIDHIIPLAKAKSAEEIIKLCHYTNLQPLCSFTNRHLKKDNIVLNKCLCCGNEIINIIYCDEKCKRKYYYHNKEGIPSLIELTISVKSSVKNSSNLPLKYILI